MTTVSRFSVLLLVGGLVSASAATITTGFSVSVGGVNISTALGLPAVQSGRNAFQLPGTGPVTVAGLYSVSALGFSSFDDPFVTFNMSGQNLTAATQTITFSIINPYVGGPYTTLTDSFQLGVSDGNGNGAVTVAQIGGANIDQPQVDGTNRDGGGVGCTLTGTPGFSQTCTTIVTSTIGIPTTPAAGTFGTVITFNISPGDIYTFSGTTTLAGTVPEPATYAYLATGLGLLLVAGRRFKTSATGR